MQDLTKRQEPINKSFNTKKYGIWLAVITIPALLFASGWAFGSGRITASGIKSGTIKNAPVNVDYASVNEIITALDRKSVV